MHDDIPDTSLEPYWENVSVSDERGGIFDGASCSQGANMTDFRAETYTKLLLWIVLWIFLICMVCLDDDDDDVTQNGSNEVFVSMFFAIKRKKLYIYD